MAVLFTQNGSVARKFRYAVEAGNTGINVGVAVPMAFYRFCGWKDSFFGSLHAWSRILYSDQSVVEYSPNM